MKLILILCIVSFALFGCMQRPSLYDGIFRQSTIRERDVVGSFRYPDVFWSTVIDLGADHSFHYEQHTDTFDHIEYTGRWTVEDGYIVVVSDALKRGTERYLVVRKKSDIGLLAESSLAELQAQNMLRFVFEQTCWRSWAKTPSKKLDFRMRLK